MSSLLPNARQRFFDNNGLPLIGGKVYFYVPSTTTLKNTYQDQAETIANTNPVILDGRGEASIWGDGDYRQVLYDFAGNLIWDRITSDISSSANAAVAALAANLANTSDPTLGDALIGVKQPFAGGVARTQHAKNAEVLSPEDFGCVGDGNTDDTVNFQAFLTAVAGKTGRMGPKVYRISASLIISGNTTLEGTPGASSLLALPGLPNTSALLINANRTGTVNTYPDQNITISGVTFDGNNNTGRTGVDLLDMIKVRNLRVIRCTFRNNSYMGFGFAGCRDVLIDISEFTACGNPAVTAEGGAALWMGAAGDTSTNYNVRVTNNAFHDNRWSAIYGNATTGLTITENDFSNNYESTIFCNNTTFQYVISNNRINGTTKKNISGSGLELGCSYGSITGNTIINTADSNISLSDCSIIDVTGNVLSLPRRDTTSFPGAACVALICTQASPNSPRYINVSNNEMIDGTGQAWAAISVGGLAGAGAADFISLLNNNMAGTTWASGKAILLQSGFWGASCTRRNNPGSVDNYPVLLQVQASGTTGLQTVSGVGFRPSLVQISLVEISTAGAIRSDGTARLALGGGITQQSNAVSSYSGTGSSAISGNVITTINTGGTQRASASLSAMTDDGFTLNWSLVSGAAMWMSITCWP